MHNKCQPYVVLFITLLTLCAFTVPMLFTTAHAHIQATSVSDQVSSDTMVKNTDLNHHQKSDKPAVHDGCCVGHHCCAIKLIAPLELSTIEIYKTTVLLGLEVEQHFSSFNVNGLDRPPKKLV